MDYILLLWTNLWQYQMIVIINSDESADKNPWEQAHAEPPPALVGDPVVWHDSASAISVSIDHSFLPAIHGKRVRTILSLWETRAETNNLIATGAPWELWNI